jgi:flagellin
MGLRINTNIQALAAQRHMGINNENLRNSLEHLASGSRINRAGDDAAGLAISEKLKADVRSLRQANRNANDGISLVQVAEGGMNEVGNMLVRLRELSIQAASDTISDAERSFIDKEVRQLKSEVDRIANTTEYVGMKLLDGSAPFFEVQVGSHNNPLNDRLVLDTGTLTTSASALGIDGVSVESKANAQMNLEMIDQAIRRVSENRATLGAFQNRIQSTIANLNIYRENLEAANSRIRDTDMAEESGQLMKNSILSQASVAVLSQSNQVPALALKLLNG